MYLDGRELCDAAPGIEMCAVPPQTALSRRCPRRGTARARDGSASAPSTRSSPHAACVQTRHASPAAGSFQTCHTIATASARSALASTASPSPLAQSGARAWQEHRRSIQTQNAAWAHVCAPAPQAPAARRGRGARRVDVRGSGAGSTCIWFWARRGFVFCFKGMWP